MNEAHSAGRSSCGKMAVTGHSSTHRPQSMHVSGSMYSISSAANFSVSSLVGWMQSTGQTVTQAVSLVPMHGWAMMWAITFLYANERKQQARADYRAEGRCVVGAGHAPPFVPSKRGRGCLAPTVVIRG